MMKVCSKCDEKKNLDSFGKDKHKKSGLTSYCKACMAEMSRIRRATNPEKSRSISKAYRERNIDKERSRYIKYNKDNPEVRAALSAKRRANQKSATPDWLTEEHNNQIKEIYKHARECEILTGDKYHVDHIIPLNGEKVSGLHVPWNLQVLPADINITKSNKYDG